MTENHARGAFIVIEGLDGAGTTTQVHALSSHLRSLGFRTFPTREPSGGSIGRVLRDAIENREKFTPEALALAFAADRLHHMHRPDGIAAMLEDGVWVISDRYVLSALAYQAAQGVEFDWLVSLNKHAPTPDVTVFVDTPLSTCIDRIRSRDKGVDDIFHKKGVLNETRRQYRRALGLGRFTGDLITIDGRGSRREVLEDVLAGVTESLHSQLGLFVDVAPSLWPEDHHVTSSANSSTPSPRSAPSG